MALQKWAAPAGVLQSTVTDTGPVGSGSQAFSEFAFAATSDIAPGATLKLFAAGTLTTTGSPTVQWSAQGFNGGGLFGTDACPAGVTDRPWTIEATIVVQSIAGTSGTFAHDIRITGLLATDQHLIGTATAGIGATFSLGVLWDADANDADAGDILTTYIADALWIG